MTPHLPCPCGDQEHATPDLSWNTMQDAPRDGRPLLLLHRERGVIEGLFVSSHWSEDSHVSPAEFQGATWSIGIDELEEIEVEEYGPEAPRAYDDGPLIGWLPRTLLPMAPDGQVQQ